MKYLNIWQLLNDAYVWWLKREFAHQIRCLEGYIEGSAFDLDLSPYEYRKQIEALRGRIRHTAGRLAEHGIYVDGHKEGLKWR
jgi:hypothetical protein